MKRYRVVKAFEQNPDAVNLVNVEDPDDIIMGAEDEFFIGDVIYEDEIEMRSHSYVDDDNAGTALFAFKKQPDRDDDYHYERRDQPYATDSEGNIITRDANPEP